MKNNYLKLRTTIHPVNGALFQIPKDNNEMLVNYNRKFIVRITADKYGKTLSISDEENGGAMYVIPLESIEDRLRYIFKGWF